MRSRPFIFLWLLPCLGSWAALAQQQVDFNVSLIANAQITFEDSTPSQYKSYNDVWGWVDSDGVEYAIIGSGVGTSIFSLKDPASPSLLITVMGDLAGWRDFKSYGNYIYAVADEGSDGLLIIDMSKAPDEITWKNWKPSLSILGQDPVLKQCHNLYIDSCYAYLAGCNNSSPRNLGAFIIDLCQDPLNPQYISTTDSIYAHDVYASNDRLYLSNLNHGFSIVDISDRTHPRTLAIQETSSDFTHNAWASDDNQFLFTTDERLGAFVDAYNISNPDDIFLLDKYRPLASEKQGAIPHNVHYHNGYLVISYYTDGLKIVDAHKPDNLVEVGSYDTYFFRDGTFGGHWGAFPFLPSGLVLSSDRSTGLYVFMPDYQRAGYLEGLVRDSISGLALEDVEIRFLSDLPGGDHTGSNGRYQTGLAEGGLQQIQYFKQGYEVKIASATLSPGSTTFLDVDLVPLSTFSIGGVIMDATSGVPIADAQVKIFNDLYESTAFTDANGLFQINSFEGDFIIAAGKWGFIHGFREIAINGDETDVEIELEVGYRDDFIFDYQWQETGSLNTLDRQRWQRGEPEYYVYDAMFANPDGDIEGDLGRSCYVTGLEGASIGNLTDTSILISPIFDVTSYSDPFVNYFLWFYDNGVNPTDDQLEIFLSNGIDEVLVETVTESGSVWRPQSQIRISDYLTPTADMTLKVLGADVGVGHIYEAGLDGFSVSEGQTTATFDDFESSATVFPNPFRQEIIVRTDDLRYSNYSLLDILGRKIAHGPLFGRETRIETSQVESGFYFLQLTGRESKTVGHKLLKP